ncbi:hypothetical protein [Escherichia phage 4E8]|uniref:Uncharacterized protein n=1 Tax=Escherichia phage vB_EcoP-101114UKE3 TaxID=2865794 RepID=A0AAE7XSQ6_9CAUD|nr:hypothetical protein PQC43_gp004 [Escherichia phage vB_EcoP-101114UKE3]QZI79135.1 hypothetical protein 101114UKE3_004 [Escherichia phage vB_EcoP-101114UKE3]USM81253.1 hypothetical protein 101114BS3_126 [Escherichia phage vB_EcoP-101114BS3]WJJ57286.1 hypothetical protein [Escherichia phage 4E8]
MWGSLYEVPFTSAYMGLYMGGPLDEYAFMG